MLVKPVTSNITRVFIVANNLQPSEKFRNGSVNHLFEHILNIIGTIVVTQKVRLKKDYTRDSKKGSHMGF